MSVDDWKNVADIAQALSASIALLAAGWWAWNNARIEGKFDESLSVTISVKVFRSHTPGLKILEVRLDLKNVGKVPCQIDLARSTVTVSRVTVTPQDPNVTWQAEPYFSGRLEQDPSAIVNIPVGASLARVTFAGVPHPGVYGVRALLALTKAGTKRFYKRLGRPFPQDWQISENAVHWDDSVIIATDTEDLRAAPNRPLQPTSGADVSG